MNGDRVHEHELRLLQALYTFYKEFGPSATPNIKGLEEEAGIEDHQLEDAVKSLSARGFIEFWELAPAIRLTEEGLIFIQEWKKDREK